MVGAGTITVAVRVRPPTASEAARLPEPPSFDSVIRGDGTLSSPRKALLSSAVRDVIEIADDRILTFDPPDRDTTRAFTERGFLPPGTKRYKDRRFMFDRVFDGQSRQQDVYEATARPLLDALLDGYNSTVFAYGATGCGKTYTISGADNEPGVIYLAMADLFQRIEDMKADANVEVAVTFLEIYNEEIRDLLGEPGSPVPRGGLAIREDKHVKVVNLTELKPKSADEVKAIVLLGNQRRTQSPTHANETSSRSHAVLQVHVTQAPRTASTTETRTMATLSIIDLAGSERASATKNMGERMIEGANINKSLLALGNCINALCESGGATRHVPYRNSKLTRLLKFSLGGNCKTVMIVCVAPTSLHFEDTHNALVYAERATKIKTKVVTRNVVNVNRHVGQYVEAINRLNLEVAELKARLAGKLSMEQETLKRKRSEGTQEVQRARADIQTKLSQYKGTMVDGAYCQTTTVIVEEQIAALRNRASALQDASGDAPGLEADAEIAFLNSMASNLEASQAANEGSQARITKARNAENLLEATLKAITERRSDRVDENGVESVKLEAKYAKTELEQLKAEAAMQTCRAHLAKQTQLVGGLGSLAARCIALLESTAQPLGEGTQNIDTLHEGLDKAIADSRRMLSEMTDVRLERSTRTSLPMTRSTLPPFSFSSGTSHNGTAKPKRTSSTALSPRKPSKSPRKSLRTSISRIAKGPSKRGLDLERKSVRWKDEEEVLLTATTPIMVVQESPVSRSGATNSESDWEDEKTDDSLRIAKSVKRVSLSQGRKKGNRLDPSYLKSHSMLESLKEVDEVRKTGSTESTEIVEQEKSSFPKARAIGGERRAPSSQLFGSKSRRSSAIGPMRSSRSRRRSSILQEHPGERHVSSARRVVVSENRSPVLGSKPLPSQRVPTGGSMRGVLLAATNTIDSVGEASFKANKPTWR